MIYLDVHTPEPEVKTGKKTLAPKEAVVRIETAVNAVHAYQAKKKFSDRTYCPYCSRETVLIWVHSHYQCSRCKYVVVSCCEAN